MPSEALQGSGYGRPAAADHFGPLAARRRHGPDYRARRWTTPPTAPPATAAIPVPRPQCLRGAMGAAVAADGSMEMQCQSCHGNMSQVGAANRVGWFMEPNCQSCHTGTATSNSGQIRYTSVLRRQRQCARGCQSDLCHHAEHAGYRAVTLPLLRRPRRPAMLRLPRLDARRVPDLRSPTTTSATSQLQGHAGVMVRMHRLPHHDRRAPSTAARTACTRSAQSWVSQHDNAARRQPDAVPGLPRHRLPRHGAV